MTNNANEALAACPFCGGRGITHRNGLTSRWAVSCVSCDCKPRLSGFDNTEAEAIAAWNRRTPAAVVKQDLAGEGDKEAQSIWRCCIGDVTAAIDILKNRWVNSKRKAEREAGAELAKVAEAVWSVRSPAPSTYHEASESGRRLITLTRQILASGQIETGVEGAQPLR